MTIAQDLTDKVAFVTGAARGIGLETVRGLGQLGAAVLMGVRDLQQGNDVAEIAQ